MTKLLVGMDLDHLWKLEVSVNTSYIGLSDEHELPMHEPWYSRLLTHSNSTKFNFIEPWYSTILVLVQLNFTFTDWSYVFSYLISSLSSTRLLSMVRTHGSTHPYWPKSKWSFRFLYFSSVQKVIIITIEVIPSHRLLVALSIAEEIWFLKVNLRVDFEGFFFSLQFVFQH